jgi:hypothetical protein
MNNQNEYLENITKESESFTIFYLDGNRNDREIVIHDKSLLNENPDIFYHN